MPAYDYQCPGCGLTEEKVHSIKEKPLFVCPDCKAAGKDVQMVRLFTINKTGFIIKGGSESINWKEKRHHMKKSTELGVKQIERYGTGPRLTPNVGGVVQESWSDAAKLAKEAGMNTDSYAPMIEKEKRTSKISGVDDNKWKKAKEANNL